MIASLQFLLMLGAEVAAEDAQVTDSRDCDHFRLLVAPADVGYFLIDAECTVFGLSQACLLFV